MNDKNPPWWVRPADEGPLCPLWDPGLLGARSGRLGAFLVVVLITAVAATRLAVLPASIWDRDEARLALAVTRFDPSAGRPHAPWFPLWVGAGKLAAPLVGDSARGLAMLSGCTGAWTLFPLAALLSIWLRRRLAVATALLYLFLPGPWFLSARAYSDTPATFLLVLAAAWWLRPRPDRRELLGGSVAASACLLVRPQHVLVVVALAVWCWLHADSRRDRFLLASPLAVAAVGAVAGLLLATGSSAELIDSFATHLGYHTRGLADADRRFAASGLARALIQAKLAAVWLVTATVGVSIWHRRRRLAGGPWPLVFAGIGPLLVTVLGVSDPTQARYALPLLAFSSGPVMVAVATALGRWSTAVVGASVVAFLVIGLPQARELRTLPSPVIGALEGAGAEAMARDGVVVVDRTLRVFADYAAETGRLQAPLLTDFSIEIGAAEIPPPSRTVAVFDRGRGTFVAACDERQDFRCRIPWMRRLGPDRFQDLTLAKGARVVRAQTRW